ncbi:3'(2'),5'-bisphosphate nucleotidase CysQ family protein [Fusibacter bizertensis]
MLKRELDVALEAARCAGEKILEVYAKDFSVLYKLDQSPVTEADVLANHVILDILEKNFPDDGFLSEEVVDDASRFIKKRCWIIDPLDGTKEFIKKNGEFSVSIGLVEDNRVILGVIYIPVRGRFYYAVRGEGAYRVEDGGVPVKLSVSSRIKPFNLLVSRSHPSQKTLSLQKIHAKDILSVTEMGSAIKGCLIAEGLYDVYYNFGHSMKWDTCAMECIVQEAGGIMRRLDHKAIDYNEEDTHNYGFYIINRIENEMDISKFG